MLVRMTLLALVAAGCGSASPSTPGAPEPASPVAPAAAGPSAGACGDLTPAACVEAASAVVLGDGRDEPKAASMYAAACDAGHGGACESLASMYATGRGVEVSLAKEAQLRVRSCELDDGMGCWMLGVMYRERSPEEDTGMLGDFDRDEARAAFARACDLGEAMGCMSLADRNHDEGAKLALYRRGCDLHVLDPCERLAWAYYRDRYPGVDATGATRALESLCDEGVPAACELAAQRHLAGDGVRASDAAAERWLTKGCDLGADKQCATLGRRHMFATRAKERAYAASMFERACTLGGDDARADTWCDIATRLRQPP